MEEVRNQSTLLEALLSSTMGLTDSDSRKWEAGLTYVPALAGYTLPRLRRESAILETQGTLMVGQQVTLANDASVTLLGGGSMKALEKAQTSQIPVILETLDAIAQHCAPAQESLGQFREAVALPTYQRHSQLRACVSKISSIMDVLEIPQVLDACVRSGAMDSALDLIEYFQSHFSGLGGKGGETLFGVSLRVGQLRSELIQALCSQLRLDVCHLPKSVQTIDQLRRVLKGAVESDHLSVVFLEHKFEFVQSKMRAIHPSSTYAEISAASDVMRVHLCDVAVQFAALFPDVTGVVSRGGALLSEWLGRQVEWYLSVLDRCLPSGSENSLWLNASSSAPGRALSAVLDSSHHAALALQRVQCQVTASVLARFHRHLVDVVGSAFSAAVLAFKDDMTSFNWVPLTALLPAAGDAKALVQLTRHRPVSLLFNALVGTLNELRLVAIESARVEVEAALDQTVTLAISCVPPPPDQRHHTERALLLTNIEHIFIPTLEAALASVYGGGGTVTFSKARDAVRRASLTAPVVTTPRSASPVTAGH